MRFLTSFTGMRFFLKCFLILMILSDSSFSFGTELPDSIELRIFNGFVKNLDTDPKFKVRVEFKKEVVTVEEKIEVADGDDNTVRAFADLIENGNKIIECKSWELGGRAFQNFVLGNITTGSVKQFITYLSDQQKVTSMDNIEYWFDKMKFDGNTDETPIKLKFKQMMYNGTTLTPAGDAIFNAIWGNVGLRVMFDLSANAIQTPSEQFKVMIADTSNSFYNFIKVK